MKKTVNIWEWETIPPCPCNTCQNDGCGITCPQKKAWDKVDEQFERAFNLSARYLDKCKVNGHHDDWEL